MTQAPDFKAPHDLDGIRKTVAQYLAASTRHLHDVPSRTDPAILASELDRLNSAVRASAGSISPFCQPADYHRALLQERDPANAAAGPVAAAPSWHGQSAAENPRQPARHLTLAQAARQMVRGELSSEQLTAQAVARATESQPTLNAYIEIWADRAMAQAR
ncbi:MAG TPA: hypothetical protein VEA17_03870, partial [Bordetella sp.]|nr:hypothetical protein [Bordetella sp.]